MTNFIVRVEQTSKEEYEVVVEARDHISVKEEWERIDRIVDYYCYKNTGFIRKKPVSQHHKTDDLGDDGTIVGTEIKLVFGTQELWKYGGRPDLGFQDYEIISVVKVDENE